VQYSLFFHLFNYSHFSSLLVAQAKHGYKCNNNVCVQNGRNVRMRALTLQMVQRGRKLQQKNEIDCILNLIYLLAIFAAAVKRYHQSEVTIH
jgi:hypothetical protein